MSPQQQFNIVWRKFLAILTAVFAMWLLIMFSHRVDVWFDGRYTLLTIAIFGIGAFSIAFWAIEVLRCLLKGDYR